MLVFSVKQGEFEKKMCRSPQKKKKKNLSSKEINGSNEKLKKKKTKIRTGSWATEVERTWKSLGRS